MRKGILKKVITSLSFVCLTYITGIAYAENIGGNPFKAPVIAKDNQATINTVNQNLIKSTPVESTVVEIPQLSERDLRQKKVLEAINKKLTKEKNVPIDNSRYVGIINGKRVYQNNDTLEYVKVEIDD